MRFLRHILLGTVAIFLVGVLLLVLSPKPALYGDTDFSVAVTDSDGRLLRLFLADDDRFRLPIKLDEIAGPAVEATLLYEDKHFRSHYGINPASVVRAAWSTWITRERVMGASTITMQLARLRYDLDTRGIVGKLTQMARALQLEWHYEKDEILEAYFNLAPYGGNVEGIATAALIYFDKSASRLTLGEALTLAVVPQNPVRRDPSRQSGSEQMQKARSRLLDVWEKHKPIEHAVRAQFGLPLKVRSTSALPFRAPHLAVAINADTNEARTIRTTIDGDAQQIVESLIGRYVDRRRPHGIENAAAMLIDSRTMHVLASVGSVDFSNDAIQGQVDGTAAKRSPGSTLKPFVYGMAMDAGIIHPSTMLKDAPTRYAAYTPENFDRGFMGPIKAQDALVYSRNVPAIRLLARVGHEEFHQFLLDADVGGLKDPDHYGLAMILGGNELTMQEIARLYAMLANGGVLRSLVRTTDGPVSESVRLMSREASYLTLDMLRHNPRPTALNVAGNSEQLPVAWKTGTSYAFRDAWTAGVFGPYVLVVWVGNFDGSSNPALVGRTAAGPLFFDIADSLSKSLPMPYSPEGPPPGLNVAQVDVCAPTGDLPGRHCPQTERAWFIPGVSPIKVSEVHRAVRVDNVSGLRTCRFDSETTHEEVFEFWPSDILALYRQAGVAIRKPPSWMPECEMDVRSTAGLAPRITTPVSGLTYHARLSESDDALPLQAVTDTDAESLFWFVNDRFMARVDKDETYFWQPAPGQHVVLAVDDLGRSGSQTVRVSVTR